MTVHERVVTCVEVRAHDETKRVLKRIVSRLTRMAMEFDGVAAAHAEHNAIDDYEHEHTNAEGVSHRSPVGNIK